VGVGDNVASATAMLHDITTKRLACLIFLTVVHDGSVTCRRCTDFQYAYTTFKNGETKEKLWC